MGRDLVAGNEPAEATASLPVFTLVDRPSRTRPPTRGATGVTKRAKPGVAQQRRPAPRDLQCANCDIVFTNPTGRPAAFCTLRCCAVADAVRYGRSVRHRYADDAPLLPAGREGRVPDDVMYAVRIKVAHALSGGYDKDARRLTHERKAEVIARDDGRCVSCGQPGSDIDHIDGPSDDLENLRLLCGDCHRIVTEAHLEPIADDATAILRDEIVARIEAPEPVRDCDRPDWGKARHAWIKAHAPAVADTRPGTGST